MDTYLIEKFKGWKTEFVVERGITKDLTMVIGGHVLTAHENAAQSHDLPNYEQ